MRRRLAVIAACKTKSTDAPQVIPFRSPIEKMECGGGEVPGVCCGSWLNAGTPPLRESCPCPGNALSGAADSAFTLRRVRHPASGSACRTHGQIRSLGGRVGPVGRISAYPASAATLLTHYTKAWLRAQGEPVEFACSGGRGRAGVALACIAALDGVPTEQAVAFVREHYDAHAVQTPWQRRPRHDS